MLASIVSTRLLTLWSRAQRITEARRKRRSRETGHRPVRRGTATGDQRPPAAAHRWSSQADRPTDNEAWFSMRPVIVRLVTRAVHDFVGRSWVAMGCWVGE